MSATARIGAPLKTPPEHLRSIRPLSHEDVARGALGRFRDVGAAMPDELAVMDAGERLTYTELALEAARVREAILAAVEVQPPPADDTRPEPVALLHTHDVHAVAALLGIIASGHPAVVLDAHTPAARLTKYIERAGTRFCVTDDALLAAAKDVVPHPVRRQDVEPVPLRSLWDAVPPLDAPATLTFTSGSTGVPKGVITDHAQLVRDAWANSLDTGTYGADDVVEHTLPMAFHAGLMVTVAGLLVGSVMDMYDVRAQGIDRLAARIAGVGGTVMQASPAILRAFTASAPDPELLRSVRSLTLAGEAAYGRDVAAVRALLPPDCVVHYRYGSSETGLISDSPITAGDPLPDGALPVGRPVSDAQLGLVDDAGDPVPPGAPGTITVTATRLASGYWGDPERTDEVFRVDADGTATYRTSDLGRIDADGTLHLLGRRDHSVKIRGYLVEPAEVDTVLFGLPQVREALTVGRPRAGDQQMRLVAYVAPAVEQPSAAELRAALREQLPGYMVPETLVFVDALPRTDRGKLDRSALPEPPDVRAGAPGEGSDLTEWERVVEAVWMRILSLPSVGRDDDFFELGGDSLGANTLMEAMVADCGVAAEEATTSVLVEAPTLGAFCERLTRESSSSGDTLVPLRTSGSQLPLFYVAGGGGLALAALPLTKHLGKDQPVYGLQAHAMERRGFPDWSVKAHARRHLRSIREVQPEGPYHLSGHSFGGLVALELAHQLTAAGEEVALLVLLDSYPPDPAKHAPPQGVRRKDYLGALLAGVRGAPSEQYWRFHLQSSLIGKRYRCAPWPGRTLVVLAQSEEKEQRAQWEDHLSGPWSMVEVPGDHISCLREPHAPHLTEPIAAALRDVQAQRARAQGRVGSGIPV